MAARARALQHADRRQVAEARQGGQRLRQVPGALGIGRDGKRRAAAADQPPDRVAAAGDMVDLDPGDIVLCAAPSYFVFLGTLANLGARSVGVAADNTSWKAARLIRVLPLSRN